MANKNGIWIVIAILALIAVGMFVQQRYDIFAIIPNGGFVANEDCTFITNIDNGGSWAITDYSISSHKWISVDVNGDGILESFAGSTSVSSNQPGICESTNYRTTSSYLPVIAFGGYRLKYGTSIYDVGQPARLIICGDSNLYEYKANYGDSNLAVTQCSGECIPNWECSDWTLCSSDLQTRICSDANGCGSTLNKPIESKSCTSCTPNWIVGSWGTCTNNIQTRTVTDANGCGSNTGKPVVAQSCIPTCTPNWNCNGWGTCTNNQQSRTCTDLNACGQTNPNPLTQSCINPETGTGTGTGEQTTFNFNEFLTKYWWVLAIIIGIIVIMLLKK